MPSIHLVVYALIVCSPSDTRGVTPKFKSRWWFETLVLVACAHSEWCATHSHFPKQITKCSTKGREPIGKVQWNANKSDSNEGNLTDEIKSSQSKRRTKTPVLVSYATLISGVLLLFGTRFLVFQWHTLLNTGVRTNIFCCWYIIAVCHLKTIKKTLLFQWKWHVV